MTSPSYVLFEQAMRHRKQIFCMYGGYPREICPIILGHSQGEEKALTYQFGGRSRSGLPRGGEWRCLFCQRSAMLNCVTDHGLPARAIPNRKAASRSSIST
jgi:hypothetical protein